MVPDAYFLVDCYKGTAVQWSLIVYKLSKLSHYVLATEKFRTPDNTLGDVTIVISKAYRNFPQHNVVLENYGSNNEMELKQIAEALLIQQ